MQARRFDTDREPAPGLRCRLEAQGDGVDAVAEVRRGSVALAGEDMPEMGTARGAPDLGADHPEGSVLDLQDPVSGQG